VREQRKNIPDKSETPLPSSDACGSLPQSIQYPCRGRFIYSVNTVASGVTTASCLGGLIVGLHLHSGCVSGICNLVEHAARRSIQVMALCECPDHSAVASAERFIGYSCAKRTTSVLEMGVGFLSTNHVTPSLHGGVVERARERVIRSPFGRQQIRRVHLNSLDFSFFFLFPGKVLPERFP
jgi:hypothetical protein